MKIVKMDNKARGITYKDNKIVFVNNALPGEDVDIKIILDKRKYSVADVSNYNIKSSKRIKPKCKYFGFCGGCQLQHLSYKNQLEYKVNYLNEIFKSLNIKIKKIHYSEEYNYRNKITLKTKEKIGFYKLNSNDIVEINNCIIADKNLTSKIKYLNKLDSGLVKEIILKSFGNKNMLVINGDNNISVEEIKNYFDCVYINNNLVYGKRIIANINNIKYLISPNAFFQVNIKIASKMFKHIKNICTNIKSKNILDLYCGCGSISLYVADIAEKVLGIELNESSIKDAIENMKLNNIKNVSFICDTTDNVKEIDNFDTLIVDPPRNGLSKSLIGKIIDSKIKNIIYVSCDPVTLKRDLEYLNTYYKIKSIEAFDMFPQTHHVETITVLERKEVNERSNENKHI